LSLLNVDQLKPGMVLGRDLLDEDGRIILPQGSVLRQSHLGRLKAWGVRHAEVEGIRQEDLMRDSVSGIDPDVMNLSREKAAKFFYLFDLAHPVDAELFRVASLKIANELSEGRVMHHLNADLLEEYAPLWDPEIPEDEAPRLSRILGDEIELSSFPDIYFKIIEVLDSPLSSAGQAADVVGQDTSLSAKLFKTGQQRVFRIHVKNRFHSAGHNPGGAPRIIHPGARNIGYPLFQGYSPRVDRHGCILETFHRLRHIRAYFSRIKRNGQRGALFCGRFAARHRPFDIVHESTSGHHQGHGAGFPGSDQSGRGGTRRAGIRPRGCRRPAVAGMAISISPR
jgi:hypothetical protein